MKALKTELKKLNGSVVVLKSLRFDGRYLDAYHTGDVYVTRCPRSKLLDAYWSKFIVHYIQDNIICLESFRYPDKYLDITPLPNTIGVGSMNHIGVASILTLTELFSNPTSSVSSQINVTHSNEIPKDKPWALFSVWGNDLSNVGIRSERWKDRWLDARIVGASNLSYLVGTQYRVAERPSDLWGQFKLIFPESIEDGYVPVASYKNSSSSTVEFSYTYTLGMTRVDSKSVENEIALKSETQRNFGTDKFTSGFLNFGASYSRKWSVSESTAFSAATEIKTVVPVPPGKTFQIKQLQAKYGPLTVYSNDFEIEEI